MCPAPDLRLSTLTSRAVSVEHAEEFRVALQELLPQVGRPLSELVLVATGDVVLVFQRPEGKLWRATGRKDVMDNSENSNAAEESSKDKLNESLKIDLRPSWQAKK